VGVVGNAASAIQFIPQIARDVAHVTIFQRSPNWMLPRNDRAYEAAELERFARRPWLARVYRWWLWFTYEMQFPAFRGNQFVQRAMRKAALKHIEETVT